MDITNPIFNDEAKAREFLEAQRWPDGPHCPHCGAVSGIAKVEGKKHRPGLYYCNPCKGQFTVTVGTLFERSKIPLQKWLLASHLLCSSKKGISTHQIHRLLKVTYKTAWFMTHRIRESMRDLETSPVGGKGKTVEADETYITRSPKTRKPKADNTTWHQNQVLSLIERGGNVRSEYLTEKTVKQAMWQIIDRESRLVTDGAPLYKGVVTGGHESVNHSKYEWARGDVHINTLEGFFSIFKRGLVGTYQHMSKKHLKRYLGEFDFRYNTRKMTDFERMAVAVQGIGGKRLTYRRTNLGG